MEAFKIAFRRRNIPFVEREAADGVMWLMLSTPPDEYPPVKTVLSFAPDGGLLDHEVFT
jgi:hypothetical protein